MIPCRPPFTERNFERTASLLDPRQGDYIYRKCQENKMAKRKGNYDVIYSIVSIIIHTFATRVGNKIKTLTLLFSETEFLSKEASGMIKSL